MRLCLALWSCKSSQ
ncbi:Protein of unknown function [Pyronema omphalodes CBS 100304]|uniref:Uncharacterized protein n=1 Tax=Pyronema omphalodes (strain CBS 100304) TaxID=1076935 RepID=U4L347_PYROM|nr:Protein of unknown function [Pyronema omphalodes CBS 100304]